MDMFKYIMALKELSEVKTKKAHEKFFRRISVQLEELQGNRWSFKIIKKNQTEALLLYKLLKKSTDSYTGAAGVPNSIIKLIRRVKTAFATNMGKGTVSYKEIIQLLEFDNDIEFVSINIKEFETMAREIGANPLPRGISISISTSSNYHHLTSAVYPTYFTEGTVVSSGNLGTLLELEALKGELSSDGVYYTLLEKCLDDLYATYLITNIKSNSIPAPTTVVCMAETYLDAAKRVADRMASE